MSLKPVHMPWAKPLPTFREQLPDEDIRDYHEAKGMFLNNACVQQKAEWLLAHPEDLRLNRR